MKIKKTLAVFAAFAVSAAGLAVAPACKKSAGDLVAAYSFDETGGSTAKESVSGKKHVIDYVFNRQLDEPEKLFKQPNDPLRKKGVKGNALYMDGFSTSITNSDFRAPEDAITLSAWVAPRTFENLGNYGTSDAAEHTRLTSLINKGDIAMCEGFVLGYGRLGLWGVQLALENEGGDQFVVGYYDPINALDVYEWSHVAASFDGDTGYIGLFYNGAAVYEGVIPELKNTHIINSAEPLYIGRYAAPSAISGIDIQMPAGLLDEIKIYKSSLSPKDIKELYSSDCGGVHPAADWRDIAEDSSVYAGDCYRPQYHAIPPAVWMNEPHAPFYYKGKYHVFYQHNPAGPYFAQLRWGHIVSDDMIHWQYVRDAVVPTAGVCPEGVWTGSATIGPDGTPWLVITAGTNTPSNGSGQNIAYAHAKDPDDPLLAEWVVEDKVVITQPNDNTQGELNQFRDPFVWKDGDTYYMLVSTSIPGAGGSANVYTSYDMREWESRGYLYENNRQELGIHWECVVLLPVSTADGSQTKYALFITPQYADTKTTVECWYLLGSFDKEACRFVADSDEPQLFDYGNGCYTGQNGFCYLTDEEVSDGETDYEQGRTILYSIAQGKDSGTAHNYQSGWSHNFAIPLELSLSDNGKEIIRRPIKELESVRGNTLYEMQGEKTAAQLNSEIAQVRGDLLEIKAKFTMAPTSEKYSGGIQVRYNPESSDAIAEHTDIYFSDAGVGIDRLKSSALTYVNKNNSHVWNSTEREYELTILLDRSMLEVYVNGIMCFTTRIYPKYANSDYLHIFDDNSGIKFTQFTVYEMGSVYSDTVTPPYYADTGNLQG